MITRNRTYDNGSKFEGKPHDYYGLSSDDKPMGEIINGSSLYLMDTQQVYMYDEEHEIWILQ